VIVALLEALPANKQKALVQDLKRHEKTIKEKAASNKRINISYFVCILFNAVSILTRYTREVTKINCSSPIKETLYTECF